MRCPQSPGLGRSQGLHKMGKQSHCWAPCVCQARIFNPLTLREVSLQIKRVSGRTVPSGTVSHQLRQGLGVAVTWWGHRVTGSDTQSGRPRNSVCSVPPEGGIVPELRRSLSYDRETGSRRRGALPVGGEQCRVGRRPGSTEAEPEAEPEASRQPGCSGHRGPGSRAGGRPRAARLNGGWARPGQCSSRGPSPHLFSLTPRSRHSPRSSLTTVSFQPTSK